MTFIIRIRNQLTASSIYTSSLTTEGTPELPCRFWSVSSLEFDAMGEWSRKRVFCNLLHNALRHLMREKLKCLTRITVDDHRCCYKHIIEIFKHEARIVRERQRLNLLYVLSDVLLTTHRLLGACNRLSIRILDDAESVLAPFSSCPIAKKFKVLGWWAQKEIFPVEAFRQVRRTLLNYTVETILLIDLCFWRYASKRVIRPVQ